MIWWKETRRKLTILFARFDFWKRGNEMTWLGGFEIDV